MKLASKQSFWLASFVASVIGLASVTAQNAGAEEPDCALKQYAPVQQGVPLLNKLPHLSRLFKNVGIGVGTLQSDCERIGIDFDFSLTGEDCCTAACCTTQTGAAQCCATPAGAQVCVSSNCWTDLNSRPFVQHAKAGKRNSTKPDKHELGGVLAIFKSTQKSQLEIFSATLEVQRESFDRERELWEALAESQSQITGLEATLELLSEFDELRSKLQETAIENVHLHAQLELAAEKEQLLQQQAALLAENAQLKARLVKREVASAKDSRAASRVAKKPESTTKTQ
jgi:hypothetical protein